MRRLIGTSPLTGYADFSALQSLPAPKLVLAAEALAAPSERAVTLSNVGDTLAFFVRLRLLDATDHELLPCFSDNYVTLLPGESLRVEVRARAFPPGCKVQASAQADSFAKSVNIQ